MTDRLADNSAQKSSLLSRFRALNSPGNERRAGCADVNPAGPYRYRLPRQAVMRRDLGNGSLPAGQ
jgi:hypothetical protein